jgi:hypothetical protein
MTAQVVAYRTRCQACDANDGPFLLSGDAQDAFEVHALCEHGRSFGIDFDLIPVTDDEPCSECGARMVMELTCDDDPGMGGLLVCAHGCGRLS